MQARQRRSDQHRGDGKAALQFAEVDVVARQPLCREPGDHDRAHDEGHAHVDLPQSEGVETDLQHIGDPAYEGPPQALVLFCGIVFGQGQDISELRRKDFFEDHLDIIIALLGRI